MVFGRSGSGKTSGSGAAMAKAFLRSGMGGLVMCAKPDEADTWERYAKETCRSESVIRIDGSGRYRFNFLEYEMQREDLKPDVRASNVVSTLQTVIEVATRAAGMEAAGRGDAFWPKAARVMLIRAVDFLYAATGRVRLGELVDFINSAPKSKEQVKDASWQNSSFFASVYSAAMRDGLVNEPAQEDLQRLTRYWLHEFPTEPEKTRGNVLMTLRADLEDLQRPQLRQIFSTETNVIPELSHEGAVILLDFPVLEWNETGVLAQMIFKYLWMRATQRRKVTDRTRPVFLWADECQLFLSSYDMEFQSTARSSRTATVLMTQNLPSFYSRIGGSHPEHTVDAMMGNLRTKIFHQNDDRRTNEWAAELIGKTSVWRASFGNNSGWTEGTNHGQSYGTSYTDNRSDQQSSGTSSSISYGQGGGSRGENKSHGISDSWGYGQTSNYSEGRSQGVSGGRSEGMQEHRDYAVEPHEFATDLKTGGPSNGNIVSGVVVLPGRAFQRNGKHWMQVGFKQ